MSETLITEKSADYELLDSGEGRKLERYGEMLLCRPDPQAIWSESLSESEWKKANAVFTRIGTAGKWEVLKKINEPWNVAIDELSFQLRLLPSKHLGLFPEQTAQWKWLSEKIKSYSESKKLVSVLNLFGYTGGASMTAARAGATVCHVDASHFAVDLAYTNMKTSMLGGKSIRFIVDDVRKFIEREIKRGHKYDVVLMDPPVYGKGAKGEVWKIEEDLLPFLSRVKNVISEKPLAVVLNGYASSYSSTTYAQLLEDALKLKGNISHGELVIRETSADRLLTCGIFARWETVDKGK